jgi:hypothetical protein
MPRRHRQSDRQRAPPGPRSRASSTTRGSPARGIWNLTGPNPEGNQIGVLAGVCGVDPFMLRDHFLRELIALGFAGIQNFPTVGLSTACFARTWRRPAWVTASRSSASLRPTASGC